MKGIFGSLFDLNGDGNLDFLEQAMEIGFLQQMVEQDEEDACAEDTDGDDLDEDALEEDWRERYDGNDLGLDPDDYDTEEAYEEAAYEKEMWISAIPENIFALAEDYHIDPVDYGSYEEFIDAVKDELG